MSLLPLPFLDSLEGLPGYRPEAFRQLHEEGRSLHSIRLHPSKFPPHHNHVTLAAPAGWCSRGYYLRERPSFTLDPLFHAGSYYVQEASSMFPEQALRQHADLGSPLRVLDLCAAPGGKSGLLQSLISEDSLLVSNETIRSRAGVLEENMTKWGGANVVVTQNDPRDFARLPDFFDVILVDAPCSGSGLFLRDAEAVKQWGVDQVQLCARRQQRILTDVLPALRPGGLLIYSTCSYSEEEDEAIVRWLLRDFPLQGCRIKLDPAWGIHETVLEKSAGWGYRFWPDQVKGEGFFLACFRKEETNAGSYSFQKKPLLTPATRAEQELAASWLKKEADLFFFRQGDYVHALPRSLAASLSELVRNRLFIRLAGIRLGKAAGQVWLPDHALALSDLMPAENVGIPLNLEQALQYLRKEEVKDLDLTPGWHPVSFEQIRLGWIKSVGNRCNNYYPREWRILKRSDN